MSDVEIKPTIKSGFKKPVLPAWVKYFLVIKFQQFLGFIDPRTWGKRLKRRKVLKRIASKVSKEAAALMEPMIKNLPLIPTMRHGGFLWFQVDFSTLREIYQTDNNGIIKLYNELISIDVVKKKLFGNPSRLWYAINFDELDKLSR